MNERISQMSGRNPDENMDKSWGDWLVTAQVTLEMGEEKKAKPVNQFTSSTKRDKSKK